MIRQHSQSRDTCEEERACAFGFSHMFLAPRVPKCFSSFALLVECPPTAPFFADGSMLSNFLLVKVRFPPVKENFQYDLFSLGTKMILSQKRNTKHFPKISCIISIFALHFCHEMQKIPRRIGLKSKCDCQVERKNRDDDLHPFYETSTSTCFDHPTTS